MAAEEEVGNAIYESNHVMLFERVDWGLATFQSYLIRTHRLPITLMSW